MPRVLALPLLFVCVSCASTTPPPHVRTSGTPQDLAALAGSWNGSYASGSTGRSGSIEFTLSAETDSARGEVIMVPRRSTEMTHASNSPDRPNAAQTQIQGPTPIRIRFVRASGDSVMGALAAYDDPDCACQVHTTFFGLIKGDVIEGRYATVSSRTGESSGGDWHVKRKR